MKKVLLILMASTLVVSCGNSNKVKGGSKGKPGVKGQIIGAKKSTPWVTQRPYGMVAIPSGSFVLGQADEDFEGNALKAPLKTVTVSSFYMDENEVTNDQYRQFIMYVRDSVVRNTLAERASQEGSIDGGVGNYAYKTQKSAGEMNAYQEYLESKGGREGEYDDSKQLDWSVPLVWKEQAYPDVSYAEVIESMYVAPEDRLDGQKRLDTDKLAYRFNTLNQLSLIKKDKPSEEDILAGAPVDSVITQQVVKVYPDTTVWLKDFGYSYNEPMFEQYFWHKAFANYPVVGVSWEQARAFCAFSTQLHNDYNKKSKKKKDPIFAYRLPSEVEWEYAAKGGLENATYPWGGPYLIDDRGCYLANFKPKRGSYIEDSNKGYMYTSPIKSFPKNGYGLYDMAGNVAEWTGSDYHNSSFSMVSSLNPGLANMASTNKKVIKGGSWKDIGPLLMIGRRDWDYKDSARSYIGFRRAQTIPEGAKAPFVRTNK